AGARRPVAATAGARIHESIMSRREGRTAFHSFSPWGRRWDEGAPALRSGIIVTPSPHPLQPKSDLSDFGHVYVAKSGKPDFARGEGVKRLAHRTWAHIPYATVITILPKCWL